MQKKYWVELSPEERKDLRQLVAHPKTPARKRLHAQILLKADQAPDGPGWTDQRIAEAFDLNKRSVERIRQRCVEQGLEDALVRRNNPSGPQLRRRLDGVGEAQLCRLACSAPPQGRQRWTLRLLADRLVELEVVQAISHETVGQTLKKMKLSLG